MSAEQNIRNRVEINRHPETDRASSLAWVTLLFGGLCWVAVPLVGAVAAVMCGLAERRKIAEGTSSPKGRTMVRVGMILATIQLIVAGLLVIGIALLGVFSLIGAIVA